MSESDFLPTILALASGKGGVGKTMVSVACAYELSQAVPTLVIDLDFFNRGLSGLFRGRREVGLIARPRYLDAIDAAPVAPWRVVEIDTNLFHIAYPDLVPDELVRLEGRSADQICTELRDFIQGAVAICGARAVVLDCHGGPDHTSFAAALLAAHTLLVSEPDRITLHGTLNFLRQLQRGADSSRTDVRLVFNKVISAFRPAFLRRMYRDLLAPEFGGHELLATFPLELPLTKAFEETPIITAAYPHSLLAKKTRILLADLFESTHPELLTDRIKTLPEWLRRRYRRTMGRKWWVFNESLPLGFLIAGAILAILFYIPTELRTRTLRDPLLRAALIVVAERNPADVPPGSHAAQVIEDSPVLAGRRDPWMDHRIEVLTRAVLNGVVYGLEDTVATRDTFLRNHQQDIIQRYPAQWREALAGLQPLRIDPILAWFDKHSNRLLLVPGLLCVAWLGVALYVQWTIAIDRRFTRAARTDKWGLALWEVFLASAMWQLPSYALVSLAAQATESGPDQWAFLLPIVLLGLLFLGLVVQQSYLIYRDIRYDPHWLESLLRLAFVASLSVGGLIFYSAWH